MKPWWEIWPGRLEAEYEALTAASLPFEVDQAALEKGILRLRVEYPLGAQRVSLVATFPDHYPYFRFEVAAPELSLRHHQHLFGKNLCLMGRATDNWRTRDTLASVLVEQLSTVLETGQSDDRISVAGREEAQAEPFEAYIAYPESVLMVQSDWAIPKEVSRGFLKIGAAADSAPPYEKLLRGVVLEVQDDRHQILAKADTAYAAFSDQVFMGRWMRSNERLTVREPKELLSRIPQLDTGGYYIQPNRVPGGFLRVFGLLHPDEVARYREIDEAWFFVCEYRFAEETSATKPQQRRENWGRR